MINKIERLLLEGNLNFKRKIMQGLESMEISKDIPKYPVLIITCIDPRIDIHRIFQLNQGDVFIYRNAGNVYTEDMLRSILISIAKFNIKYIIILGHIDCGMTKINLTDFMKKLPPKFLSNFSNNYSKVLTELNNFIKPFKDEIENIRRQIKALEKVKEFYPKIEFTGMLYDVKTGLVFEYEKFRDYKDIKDFQENYKELILEKKNQFTDYLDKIKAESLPIEYSNDISQVGGSNEIEVSSVSEKSNEPQQILFNKTEDSEENHSILTQTFIPKIMIPKLMIPKIQFHGVNIYIPKRFSRKREFVL